MSEFIAQIAWARRLGISVQTFREWRRLGLIPLPSGLPGHPRWPADVVERTTAQLKVRKHKLFESHRGDSRRVSRSMPLKGVENRRTA